MATYKGVEINLVPSDAMAEEAERGLAWRQEFGRGGTEVGIARARDIKNKVDLSPETIGRMTSFFARHEVDKQAEGFRPGEDGYPSNGRIAWALWGGDPGKSWAEAKAARMDSIDENDRAAPGDLEVGDFVSWDSSGGTARGRIEHIMREGVLGIPDSEFSINATPEDPAALIRIYREGSEGWEATETLVGHRFSTLRKINALRGYDERPYPNEHAARLRDPDQYERFRRENDAFGEGIDAIYGITGGTAELQAIRFDSRLFSPSAARAWLDEHDYSPIEFEEAIGEDDMTDEQRMMVTVEVEIDTDPKPEMEEPEAEADDIEDDIAMEMAPGMMLNEDRAADLSHRSMLMGAKPVDETSRRVRIAVSSEMPVERSFGVEVLDHTSSSIDLSFLGSGRAPLLLDHDPRQQIGIVEDITVDSSARVMRATVRFGRSGLAKEVFDDVVDGIRSNISVGYRVNNMVREDAADGTIFRVNDWTPLEVSVVSIPADASVGVGRSAEIPKITVVKESPMTEVNHDEMRAEFARNAKSIMDLGAKHNKRDLAEKAVADGLSVEQFRGVILDAIGTEAFASNAMVGLTVAEKRNYSLLRAINAAASNDWRKAGFERELSDEIAKRTGKDARGFYVPNDIRWSQRDVTTGIGTGTSKGGYLVGTDHRGDLFIDALREALVISSLGARMMTGLQGNVAIPKLSTRTAVAFVAEGSAPTEGAPVFAQVTMSPKTVAGYVDLSRRLMIQSDPSVEAVLRDDITRQIAGKIDEVAIEGGGSNEPVGILGTSGIGAVTIGTNGGAPTYATVVNLQREVAIDNALTGSLAYLTNSKVVSKLRQTAKQTSGVEGNFILGETNNLLGYQVAETNLVPSDLTKGSGSALSAMIFGNFNDLMIGMFSGLDIVVDTSSLSTSGGTRIAFFQDVDVAVRNAQSFAACKEIVTT
jgi:HK97 family phage major capsid protein